METQHTGGEWIISVNDYEEFEVILNDNELGTCIVASIEDLREVEANARLIAAAPEMLDRLQIMYNMLDDILDERNWYKKGYLARAKQLMRNMHKSSFDTIEKATK